MQHLKAQNIRGSFHKGTLMTLPILILAAGQSSRMRGVDKLLENIDGVALLRRQINITSAVGGPVFVALPDPAHPRTTQLTGTNALPIFVPNASEGLGVTLREAVAALPTCPAFMVVLADLAALEGSDLATILNARENNPNYLIWRGATEVGKPGHPIIFDASLRPAFANLAGDTGGAAILKSQKDQTCLVPIPGHRALLDLDTPEDWARWRAETR
ncbi:MAG: molybdenum cofactor cytidylyltransferase [Yoonia sp.]